MNIPRCISALTIILTFWIGRISLYGQDTASQTHKEDSAHLQKTTDLLRTMDSMKAADSLRRATLLQEIENLKGAEANKQREALLKQLRDEQAEDSIREVSLARELARLKSIAKGYPVAPFNDTLFMIHTKVGSFTPAERASAITEKIKNLYRNDAFRPDSLSLIISPTSADIVFRDMVVMSVNEMDALWFGKKPEALGGEYKDIIAKTIAEERSANSIKNILVRIGAIILILAGIYVLIRLINRLFRRLNRKVIRMKESVLKGIKFKGYQFLDSDRELRVAIFLLNIGRLLIIALALYITLPLMFAVFPWSRGIAVMLLGWITKPLGRVFTGIISYLPDLFTIIVIIVITHYAVRFLRFIGDEIERGALNITGFYPDWAKPTFNLVKILLYAFSFIMIFPYLPGSDSPIFRGVSVFLGILFSLGSSSAISNAVAGFVITYMRPFKKGDRIKIGEVTGDVVEKSLLVTRVRTIKNEDITIPNAAVLSGHTINYTTSAIELGLILNTSVTIGYDVPWKKVHELLIDAALSTRGIIQDENRKPFVLQTSLDDFYVAYQVNCFTADSHRTAHIYSELHQNIQDKFNEAGVEIMSPHYRAARDGNTIAIPPNYVSREYKAPSFNLTVDDRNESGK